MTLLSDVAQALSAPRCPSGVKGGLSDVAPTIFAVGEGEKSGGNGFAGPEDKIFLSSKPRCSH